MKTLIYVSYDSWLQLNKKKKQCVFFSKHPNSDFTSILLLSVKELEVKNPFPTSTTTNKFTLHNLRHTVCDFSK